MYGYFAYMYDCESYKCLVFEKARRGSHVKCPGTGATDSCELLCGHWCANSGSLEEQPTLKTAEPVLQPPTFFFMLSFVHGFSLEGGGHMLVQCPRSPGSFLGAVVTDSCEPPDHGCWELITVRTLNCWIIFQPLECFWFFGHRSSLCIPGWLQLLIFLQSLTSPGIIQWHPFQNDLSLIHTGIKPDIVTHTFNSRTKEAEAGKSMIFRTAWFRWF